jgi:RNA recognition motif-containing protein
MKIYVGNLGLEVNEHDLEEVFSEYGTVSSTKIVKEKMNDRSRGFGFVEMENQNEAEKAIKGLDGSTLQTRKLLVNEARPRKNSYGTF